VCEAASLEDLDPDALTEARAQFVVKHPGQAAEMDGWDDRTSSTRHGCSSREP
jgi:ATP-dependent DNA helicase RecG